MRKAPCIRKREGVPTPDAAVTGEAPNNLRCVPLTANCGGGWALVSQCEEALWLGGALCQCSFPPGVLQTKASPRHGLPPVLLTPWDSEPKCALLPGSQAPRG